MKLRPYQLETIQSLISLVRSEQPLSNATLSMSRQCGKSYSLLLFCVLYLNTYIMKDIIFLCPSYGLCKEHLRTLSSITSNNRFGKFKFNLSSLELESDLTHSRVLFYSAGSKDKLRGLHADLLIIDEAAYISDDVIDLVQAFRTSTLAPSILCSTKLRTSGRFYEYYSDPSSLVLDYSPDYIISHGFPDFAHVLDSFKKTLSPSLYRIDFLNEFLSSDTSLLFGDLDSRVRDIQYKNQPLTLGIDWSSNLNRGDRCSVSATYQLHSGEVVELFTKQVYDGRGPESAVRLIADIIEPYLPYITAVYSESNSLGIVYSYLLRKRFPSLNIYDDNWSAQSKNEQITNLIALVRSSKLYLHPIHSAKLEMMNYGATYSPQGKISYGNVVSKGDDNSYHDDSVASLAHACSRYNSNAGTYCLS